MKATRPHEPAAGLVSTANAQVKRVGPETRNKILDTRNASYEAVLHEPADGGFGRQQLARDPAARLREVAVALAP